MKQNLPDCKWYVVYTRFNAERKVIAGLTKIGIDSYLPVQKVMRQWSDRKKEIEIPLFPNYVFVKSLLMERFRILDIPGIVGFVSTTKEFDIVSQKEIDLIQNIVAHNPEVSTHVFTRGDLVKVIKGPFNGMNAMLEDVKGRYRLSLRVECINKVVKVDISPDCICRIRQHDSY